MHVNYQSTNALNSGAYGNPVDFGQGYSTHMKPAEDSMSKLRVHNFAISLDGYGAGPRQGLKDPLGVGGEELHGWYIGTRAFREINGKTGGTTGGAAGGARTRRITCRCSC